MEKYLEDVDNLAVFDSLIKAKSVINRHSKIFVSISGGSDSDIVLDIVEKTRGNKQVEYVFFDTGIEYQATKNHLKFLEEKYGIEIKVEKAIKPIPTCVRKYGVPFISKFVSENISRLQRSGFKFEDEPFEVLKGKYPNCISSLQWWCNCKSGDEMSRFNISQNKWLKEFLIKYPPTFKIDNKCCYYAKKKVAKKFVKEKNPDLSVIGVRKSEGGVRATAYKSCFSSGADGLDHYRPIFYMNDDDKQYYEKKFDVCHSDCYKKYGLKRTGCVGCPYGRNLKDELEAVKMFEPKLYKAINNIFGESYEYTKKYRQFCAEMKEKENANEDQMSFDDIYYDFAEVQ